MRAALLVSIALASVVVTGCKNKEASLVGSWKGELKMNSANPNDPMTKMLNAMSANFTLDLKENKTFAMSMGPIPMEGTWSLAGEEVSLQTTKVMGMSVDEAEKLQAQQAAKMPGGNALAKSSNLREPLKLKIESDGKLKVIPKPGEPGGGDLTFTKSEPVK